MLPSALGGENMIDSMLKHESTCQMYFKNTVKNKWRSAEFFAGIGLVRAALQEENIETVWANDIEVTKAAIYNANFESSDFILGDIRDVKGSSLPVIDLATASFPCTDLSLAGARAGLGGRESSMFWEFARVLREMAEHSPQVIMLENVPGFATSHQGKDLADAIKALNHLGYTCDLFLMDARFFVPQSRQRLFIVGTKGRLSQTRSCKNSITRPHWIRHFYELHPELDLQIRALPEPPHQQHYLSSIVERIPHYHSTWWDEVRTQKFIESLSELQNKRLRQLQRCQETQWRTAYRRTRNGKAVWEIRQDEIAGCLRTARGGSSKQALIETSHGKVYVRWLTPREYARLQGVPDTFHIDHVKDSQAYFGFGDAVCLPVIRWIAKHYLLPALAENRIRRLPDGSPRRMWPFFELEDRQRTTEEVKNTLNAAEYTVFNEVLGKSSFSAVLNEKPITSSNMIGLPQSFRKRIIPDELYELRKHPDIRIARRANTIARLAQVISERSVSKGLRHTLVVQAQRLERLAANRLAEFFDEPDDSDLDESND
mgnify:FL=1